MTPTSQSPSPPLLPLTSKQWLLGLVVASLGLYLSNLGGLALRDWDEATYATAARGMVQTGDWLHPTLLGIPYLNKPPLGLWLIASSYKLFGVSEWATRLPLALISSLGVPLLYLNARKLFNAELPARLSSLIYLTLLPLARHGRLAMLDGGMITLFLLLLFCYLNAKHHRRWLWGVGLCFGAMALLKGILAILLTSLVLALLCWERQFKLLRYPGLWLSGGVGLIPLGAWYLAQGNHYGANFWQVHLMNQAINRTWDSVSDNTGPVWFYVAEILKYTWPWLVFLPAGLYLGWQQRQTSWGKLIWIGGLGFLAIISAMKTKLPWYVVPIYPCLALAIGAELAQVWQHLDPLPRTTAQPSQVKAYKFYLAFLIFLSILGLVVSILYGSNGDIWVGILGALLVPTAGGAAYLLWQQQNRFILWLLTGMYLGLMVFVHSPVWIWELNEAFDVKPVALLIQAQIPLQGSPQAQAPIYATFGYGRPSLNFYSERPISSVKFSELPRLFKQKEYLLLDHTTVTEFAPNSYNTLGTAEGLVLIKAK
jgi:4-amino-4-deoxy-L-arabinose transferase-like glycosyltransferase